MKYSSYNMGATMFELICVTSKDFYGVNHTYEAWSASKALYDVAVKAVSTERKDRYQAFIELVTAWNDAKKVNDFKYRQMFLSDITQDMLTHFNRYQYVENDWYPDGHCGYFLVHQPHVENWDNAEKIKIIEKWRIALNNGGKSFCAYDGNKLVGLSFIDGVKLGFEKQYIELLYFHVSYEYRAKGIGKKLFCLCAEAALELQCKKLYIVASSSEESQKAYHKLGCVYAKELIPHLYEQRPYDVHMEYVLK